MSGPLGSSQWMYNAGGDFYPTEIDQSLMFDSTAYLSRTPSVAGNRKTWTWSGWVKRGTLSTNDALFHVYGTVTATTYFLFRFESSGALYVGNSNTNFVITTQVFRDPSAWYHVVLSLDTTQATATDRLKLYINGSQVTSFSSDNRSAQIALNSDQGINQASAHTIGRENSGAFYFDGYLADTYFIDGTALDPTSFGEFKSGVWIPKAYTGSYGTNGFHLTYQDDTVSEGFNTVTWNGNSATQSISGVGFSPDLVWIKDRNVARNHRLTDAIRGVTKTLSSDTTGAEETDASKVSSFNSDGFTLELSPAVNGTGETYVGWCWDAGDSTVSNTSGTIPSSVRANPAYGFSIVSYTGNVTDGATVGHGLGVAPNMFIVKDRDSSVRNWKVYHSSLGETLALDLNEPNSESAGPWSNTAPTSTVFTLGGGVAVNNTNDYIAYCFADIAGYSKFGSYTGNQLESGPTVTLGFKPAFVMIKRTDVANSWVMYDNTRQTTNPKDLRVLADSPDFEFDGNEYITFTDTGFEIQYSGNLTNASGGTYIYMAFADTRDLAFWRDQSGNGNDWQPNNLNYQDTVFDSPTNNYATLNPLDRTTNTIADLSDGNLTFKGSTSNSRTTYGTFTVASQKWYYEVNVDLQGSIANRLGLRGANSGVGYRANGQKLENGTFTAYGATWTAGDLIGVAFDCDTQTIEFFKNNVSQGSFSYTNSVDSSNEVKVEVADGSASFAFDGTVNFGQSGFTYTPPDGFLALCTANLPEPSISPANGDSPQDHFNTVLYTGNGGTQTVSGVGFEPDFTWVKQRGGTTSHWLNDAVRGAGLSLASDTAEEEKSYAAYFTAFNNDGFSLAGGTGGFNATSGTYVAWNWKASNAASVLNDEGTITSQVSANPTAGFSVVSYTGTGADNATIGHSLNSTPSMIIAKSRSVVGDWRVWHQNLSGAGYYLTLDITAAQGNSTSVWGTSPAQTSTTFTIGTNSDVNTSSATYLAYCFHSVEGYSKFGSYTGNGSLDGTFVYTGFRPAFILFKNTSISQSWVLYDTARDAYNAVSNYLLPDSPNGEGVLANADFLSNGFKLRWTSSINNSGNNFIYMAFAENPFKYANAR